MTTSCPACQMGRMKLITATYVQFLDGTLIQAPDTTAWQCDICGETFFDGVAIQAIETLIGAGGLPPNHQDAAPDASPAADSGSNAHDKAVDHARSPSK